MDWEPGRPLRPCSMLDVVACRYIGAHTLQTWENSDACAMATSTSTVCTVRSALAVC
jgi:hypothetical protein